MKSKVKEAIEILREYEPPDGYYLAFSGGKDSIVCYDLLKRSGVKFDAHYNSTTIDPPQLLRYMKANYPDVEWHYPVYKGKPTNFYQLVKKRGLPIRQGRWCCEAMKEGGWFSRLIIDGVRAAESSRRAKRQKFEYFLKPYWNKKFKGKEIDIGTLDDLKSRGLAKNIIHIIFDWSDKEIWDYIKANKIPYCDLYDQGWDRIGCICCPMAKKASKKRDIKLFPVYKTNILKSIKFLMNKGKFNKFEDEQDVLNWWLTNDSVDKYLGSKQQLKIDI